MSEILDYMNLGLFAGTVTKGQQVELLGHGRNFSSVTVSDVQAFKKSVPHACAGENVGVLLKGVKPEHIERFVVFFFLFFTLSNFCCEVCLELFPI